MTNSEPAGRVGQNPEDVGADRTGEIVAALAAGLTDSAIVMLWANSHAPVGVLLAAHFAVIAGLVTLLWRRVKQGGDSTVLQLVTLTMMVMGPLGALATLMMVPWSGTGAKRASLLTAWYDRIAGSVAIDAASQLAERVATGRTMDLSAPLPRAFKTVIESGALADRQTALGLIARKFHPDYGAALKAALRSDEPVVRVQAAAVAARVRSDLQGRVRAALDGLDDRLKDPARALATATEIEAALQTGLLIEGDRLRGEAALAPLKAAALAANLGETVARAARLPAREARTLEAALLAAHRFGDFRRLRSVRMLASRGFSVRRVRLERQATRGSAVV